jgi:mono/diheme cytochrome c family protein
MKQVVRVGTAMALVLALALAATSCGGGGQSGGATGSESTATETTTVAGDAARGEAIFAAQHCGGCHTLAAAGATGTVGPNLDQQLGASAQKAGESLSEFTRESIVNPNAFLAEGYSGGIMPTSFGDDLSDQEIADLVAFVDQSVQG